MRFETSQHFQLLWWVQRFNSVYGSCYPSPSNPVPLFLSSSRSFSLSLFVLYLYINFCYLRFVFQFLLDIYYIFCFLNFFDQCSANVSAILPTLYIFLWHNICIIKFINIIGHMLLALLIFEPHLVGLTAKLGFLIFFTYNRMCPCVTYTYFSVLFGAYVNLM